MSDPEQLFRKPRKSVTLIPAIGLLIILIGYVFVIYMVKDASDRLASKRSDLAVVTEELNAKLDTMTTLNNSIRVLQAERDSMERSLAKIDSITKYTTYSPVTIQKIITAATTTPKVIYVQVSDEKTRQFCADRKLLVQLKERGYSAYGYELVRSGANNSVRYFHAEDEQLAQDVAKVTNNVLNERSLFLKPVFSQGYGQKVQKGQVEIWLGVSPKVDVAKEIRVRQEIDPTILKREIK